MDECVDVFLVLVNLEEVVLVADLELVVEELVDVMMRLDVLAELLEDEEEEDVRPIIYQHLNLGLQCFNNPLLVTGVARF